MAIPSLSRSLGARFLERLTSLATNKSTAGNPLAALASQDAAITGSSLRSGAELMVRSIELLAAGFQAVEGTRAALNSFDESIDELIGFAEAAADPATGQEDRDRLVISYQQKANELKRVVEGASDGDNNLITKTGLTEVLNQISLNPEDLEELSKVLGSIESATSDGDLFDPTRKAERPLSIPPNLPSSSDTTDYASVLDGSAALTSRRGAYNLLADLKEVKRNLDTNKKAIGDLSSYISDARTLVRTVGLSLLDLTSLADGGASAEQLSLSLQSRVRADARGALDQLESLGPLVGKAATLLDAA
jgi:hypothetical protein